jgi:hypothetical protein
MTKKERPSTVSPGAGHSRFEDRLEKKVDAENSADPVRGQAPSAIDDDNLVNVAAPPTAGARGPRLVFDRGRLPIIQVRSGELASIATRAEQVLLDAGVEIFQRSGTLVRPVVAEVDAAHGRRTKAAQLKRVDPAYPRDLLGRVAAWERFDRRNNKWVPASPPPVVAAMILARVGEWRFPDVPDDLLHSEEAVP